MYLYVFIILYGIDKKLKMTDQMCIMK